jgi:hypothetical protein
MSRKTDMTLVSFFSSRTTQEFHYKLIGRKQPNVRTTQNIHDNNRHLHKHAIYRLCLKLDIELCRMIKERCLKKGTNKSMICNNNNYSFIYFQCTSHSVVCNTRWFQVK